MRVFSNRFQIAITDDKSEITLNFLHEEPIMPIDSDKIAGIETEVVASLVLNNKNALDLANTLNEMLNN